MKNLKEVLEQFKELPKDVNIIVVANQDAHNAVFASGNPMEITAALCKAQEKDEIVRDMLQAAVEVYKEVENEQVQEAKAVTDRIIN